MVKMPKNSPFVTGERKTLVSNTLSVKDWIYEFFFDTDIQNRYLIKNYEAVLGIIFSYVLYVKWIGPYYMKNRKPYNLKNVMIIYNFTNAFLSAGFAWMMYTTMRDNWSNRCGVRTNNQYELLVKENRPKAWMWFLHKHLDLLDTVFFILRRKNNNVSNLHVIHHAGLILLGLYFIKYNVYSFFLLILIMLNSMIHVLMYIYYGLAAFGPHMQKYLWWKAYMTQIQIAQFIIALIYLAHAFATGCELMETHELSVFAFTLLILLLFLNFYRKRYKQHQS